MNTVAVRPRLDLHYDVIRSIHPQLVGVRDTKEEGIVLGEWAAKRIAPSTLTVFGIDGATVLETRTYAADPNRPTRSASAAH